MTILSVATTYPRWAGDTERAFVHDLNRHLVKRGHKVVALVPHVPRAADEEELDGVRILRFHYAPVSFERVFGGGGALPNLRASWRARFALPGAVWALKRSIARHTAALKPDILHVHWLLPQGYFALKTAARNRVPLVVTAHGADIHRTAKGWLRPAACKVVRCADALTANTPDTARHLRALAEPRRLEVLAMGLDLGLFSPNRKDPELRSKLGAGKPWILAIGRLAEKKGFQYLVEAMPVVLEAFPEASLTFGGEGPEEEPLKKQAKALGLENAIRFLGPLDRQTVADQMASADLFVGPSVVDRFGDTEGQGVVFVEAMASGCPVVATTVGGIPDVIATGKNGLLVLPNDSTALANAIIDSLRERDATQERTKAALADVGRYDWTRIAEGFEALFQSMLPGTSVSETGT